MSGNGTFLSLLPTGLFGVGLPTSVAAVGASLLQDPHQSDEMTALVVGTGSVGIMMITGELPFAVDLQTLALIGICAAGYWSGVMASEYISHGK